MLHLKRGFTYFLCFNIIITSFPGWVFAALIQSHDESTTVLKARNQKTQLIYIATPNENGLSHNRYNRFDVDQNGAVFINFNDGKGEARRSDLAASVIGNPALLNGGSASLILNEVVSGKTSNIAGFLEVVGNKAGVIIANCQVSPRCSLSPKITLRNISGSLINKSGFKLYQYSKAS